MTKPLMEEDTCPATFPDFVIDLKSTFKKILIRLTVIPFCGKGGNLSSLVNDRKIGYISVQEINWTHRTVWKYLYLISPLHKYTQTDLLTSIYASAP